MNTRVVPNSVSMRCPRCHRSILVNTTGRLRAHGPTVAHRLPRCPGSHAPATAPTRAGAR